jgi:hypothetical protein
VAHRRYQAGNRGASQELGGGKKFGDQGGLGPYRGRSGGERMTGGPAAAQCRLIFIQMVFIWIHI